MAISYRVAMMNLIANHELRKERSASGHGVSAPQPRSRGVAIPKSSGASKSLPSPKPRAILEYHEVCPVGSTNCKSQCDFCACMKITAHGSALGNILSGEYHYT